LGSGKEQKLAKPIEWQREANKGQAIEGKAIGIENLELAEWLNSLIRGAL
jgi:hypothetical protein